MDISCGKEGERRVKLVADDDHGAVSGSVIHMADLPNHMISATPRLDNTILLHAAPQIQMVSNNRSNNGLPLQDNDSLLITSNSRGSRSKCLVGGHVDKHDEAAIIISYKECLRNHAASTGGYATDGCGEFMASISVKEGAIQEALNCSACNCHRNFHRKEVKSKDDHFHIAAVTQTSKINNSITNSDRIHCHSPGRLNRSRVGERMQYVTASGARPFNNSNEQGSEEPLPPPSHYQAEGHLSTQPSGSKTKKSTRSSFCNEQNVQMTEFGKRVGWKIQKQDESGVLQLCEEIGVKRRVLKAWMHNKKHSHEGRKHQASPTAQTTGSGSGSGSGRDALFHQ